MLTTECFVFLSFKGLQLCIHLVHGEVKEIAVIQDSAASGISMSLFCHPAASQVHYFYTYLCICFQLFLC